MTVIMAELNERIDILNALRVEDEQKIVKLNDELTLTREREEGHGT